MNGPATGVVCHGGVCITCSDAAFVVGILELLVDDTARVDTEAVGVRGNTPTPDVVQGAELEVTALEVE